MHYDIHKAAQWSQIVGGQWDEVWGNVGGKIYVPYNYLYIIFSIVNVFWQPKIWGFFGQQE